MPLFTIGYLQFWIGSLFIFCVATGLQGKKDSLRKQKEWEQRQDKVAQKWLFCWERVCQGPEGINGFAVSAQPCPGSPNPARSPGPHFSSPAALPLAGTVGRVLAAMPCPGKPCERNPHHCRSSGITCPLTEMRNIRVWVLFDKPDWGISYIYSSHGQEKISETNICTPDCEPQPLLHTIVLPFPPFSVFLPSVFCCTVLQQQYLRIKDDPFPKAYCTVFCISLFLTIRCRHSVGGVLAVLDPHFPHALHSAQCIGRHVRRQLALSSVNTFSNMTVICQPMSWSKHDPIFNISFARPSPKIIVSQEKNKALGPRCAVGVSCFRFVKDNAIKIKAGYRFCHSSLLVLAIMSSVALF